MKRISVSLAFFALLGLVAPASPAYAQIPRSLMTPDRVDSRIGRLEFKDGAPSKATVEKLYDQVDFDHAYDLYMNSLAGVSIASLHKGLQSAGVQDNEVVVFSDLMDAKSLFLTANADTVYVMGAIDLTKGPMVLEVAPRSLGVVQDYWFGWVIDLGAPGPDRGEGGKYLLLPPGYDGPLPEGEFFVARSKTNRVLWFTRSFMKDHKDPKPVADDIRKFTRIYPYQAGGVGTPIAEFLAGHPDCANQFHEWTVLRGWTRDDVF